ncbi:LOW QUALITY PROTEIN: uncharacterized protein [Asterias amurensis]|uniref:LOW QUALITY PROTEIN: uncharacterized protein n=1 Tax=Asterias amurensis TaxID=7602 RepID=UPI003AB90178
MLCRSVSTSGDTNPLQMLHKACSPSEEINALQELSKSLTPTVTGEDDIERQWLSIAADNLGDGPCNPFPAYAPQDFFSKVDLERFTCYLFERRFSWSEARKPAILTERDAELKSRLNFLLDEFLKWYLCQEISQVLLLSLQGTVNHAPSMPVVRNQTIIHIMEWLQLNASHPSLHKHFNDAQAVVLCGVCDVWSAIRNGCVTRLGRIVNNFTLQEVQGLFTELTKICENPSSTWQSIEGALMAMSTLLKSFQWIGVLSTSSSDTHCNTGKYFLKFGTQELSQLPEFVSNHIHMTVYPLLAHPQLGVRENATKALSTYLSRCDFKVALKCLREAVSRLCQSDQAESWSSGDCVFLQHAVLKPSYKFLDAYEAEGLLSVCLYLIKYVQSGVLLPYWMQYFSTFNLYLMHPASTVRQAASIIFKYIVAKESSNPGLLKLVLQALCANWSIDISLPNTKSDKSTVLQEGENKISITTLNMLTSENLQSDMSLSHAWEWREGRLFAYELIVKFLIINHIHYLFPSYALPPSKFDGSVSADDAVPHSHQPMSTQRATLSKSLSYVESNIKNPFVASADDGRLQSGGVKSKTSWSDDRSASTNQPLYLHQDNPHQCLTRSGSDRRKTIEERRSRTLAEGTFLKRQLSRHYSYFTNKAAVGEKRSSVHTSATSLLCKARDLDATLNDTEDESCQLEKLCISSPMSSVDSETRESLPADVLMLLQLAQSASKSFDRNDAADVDWIHRVKFEKLSTIFRHILLQTISCLDDDRWEVRRMSQQALPLITECIRWYDMSILASLWNGYLLPDDSLLSYGLALTLAVSIHHVVRLVHFMDTPPASWKDPDVCRGITLPIITALTEGIASWCDVALAVVNRTTADKLTVITLEIVMTTLTYFPELLSERHNYDMAVLKRLLHVFCHAHPEHAISQQNSADVTPFNTPADGYLCCCHKAESQESAARHVERFLLTDIHHLIPTFLQSCSVLNSCVLLPLMLHWVAFYHEDSHMTKYCLEGCTVVVNKALRWMDHIETHQHEELVSSLRPAVIEITSLVQHMDLEIMTLKQVLDLSIVIVTSIFQESTDVLRLLLSAVASRFNQSANIDAAQVRRDAVNEDGDNTVTTLVYRSNNIPASPVDTKDSSDDEEEEEKKHSCNYAPTESLSLSVSGSSGQTLWPAVHTTDHDKNRLSTTASNQNISDSDWDSWDDEQEEQSSFYCMANEFLRKLQLSYRNIKGKGEESPFNTALHQLEEKDQMLVNQLLTISTVELTT